MSQNMGGTENSTKSIPGKTAAKTKLLANASNRSPRFLAACLGFMTNNCLTQPAKPETKN